MRAEDATCGQRCWNARSEECTCACGGKNHGIMRRTGRVPTAAEMPVRVRMVGEAIYKLAHVIPGPVSSEDTLDPRWKANSAPNRIAVRIVLELYGVVPQLRRIPTHRGPYPEAFAQRVDKASWRTWPETRKLKWSRPWLVWIRENVKPLDWPPRLQ